MQQQKQQQKQQHKDKKGCVQFRLRLNRKWIDLWQGLSRFKVVVDPDPLPPRPFLYPLWKSGEDVLKIVYKASNSFLYKLRLKISKKEHTRVSARKWIVLRDQAKRRNQWVKTEELKAVIVNVVLWTWIIRYFRIDVCVMFLSRSKGCEYFWVDLLRLRLTLFIALFRGIVA